MASDEPGESAPREPLPDWVHAETEDWDRIERITRRVGRFIPVFLPVWFLALLMLGATVGPTAPVFVLGTVAAGLISWRIERRWTAHRDRSAPGAQTGPPRPRRSLGPVGAMAIGAGFVVLLVYMVWVLSTAS